MLYSLYSSRRLELLKYNLLLILPTNQRACEPFAGFSPKCTFSPVQKISICDKLCITGDLQLFMKVGRPQNAGEQLRHSGRGTDSLEGKPCQISYQCLATGWGGEAGFLPWRVKKKWKRENEPALANPKMFSRL